jgi:hypothetical protein
MPMVKGVAPTGEVRKAYQLCQLVVLIVTWGGAGRQQAKTPHAPDQFLSGGVIDITFQPGVGNSHLVICTETGTF